VHPCQGHVVIDSFASHSSDIIGLLFQQQPASMTMHYALDLDQYRYPEAREIWSSYPKIEQNGEPVIHAEARANAGSKASGSTTYQDGAGGRTDRPQGVEEKCRTPRCSSRRE
jgi:hypothetical protein